MKSYYQIVEKARISVEPGTTFSNDILLQLKYKYNICT